LAKAGPLGLLAAIAIATFLLLGYGFPLAMRLAAAFATDDAMRAQLSAAPGDADLAAKIPRQFRRVAAFAAATLVLIAASEPICRIRAALGRAGDRHRLGVIAMIFL